MPPRGQAAVQVQAGSMGYADLPWRPAIATGLVSCERPRRADGRPVVQVGVWLQQALLHCWLGLATGWPSYPCAVVPPVPFRAGLGLLGSLIAAPQAQRLGLQLYAVCVCAVVPPPLGPANRWQDRLPDARVDPSGAGQEGCQVLCKGHIVTQPICASSFDSPTGMPEHIQSSRGTSKSGIAQHDHML